MRRLQLPCSRPESVGTGVGRKSVSRAFCHAHKLAVSRQKLSYVGFVGWHPHCTPPSTGLHTSLLSPFNYSMKVVAVCRYDDTGFIVNDMQVEGPVLCYGDLVTLWRVKRLADITMQSLALMDLVKPTPGVGPRCCLHVGACPFKWRLPGCMLSGEFPGCMRATAVNAVAAASGLVG